MVNLLLVQEGWRKGILESIAVENLSYKICETSVALYKFLITARRYRNDQAN